MSAFPAGALGDLPARFHTRAAFLTSRTNPSNWAPIGRRSEGPPGSRPSSPAANGAEACGGEPGRADAEAPELGFDCLSALGGELLVRRSRIRVVREAADLQLDGRMSFEDLEHVLELRFGVLLVELRAAVGEEQ